MKTKKKKIQTVSHRCLLSGGCNLLLIDDFLSFPGSFSETIDVQPPMVSTAGLTYLLAEATLRLRAGFLEGLIFSGGFLLSNVEPHRLLAIRFRFAADFLQQRSADAMSRQRSHTHGGPCVSPSGSEWSGVAGAALQEKSKKNYTSSCSHFPESAETYLTLPCESAWYIR